MLSARQRQILVNNLLWFGGALIIAIIVWFIATVQADPISQRNFLRVPIQILVDDGMIITNSPQTSARVIVRAQQSVLELLTTEDIIIRADLRSREANTHTVPLIVEIARPASADTQPTQITVAIEPTLRQQKPVDIVESAAPPSTYTYEVTERDIFQTEVSGAPARVNAVVRVIAELDLADQRSDFERILTLMAVDENDNEVTDVTINPRIITVNVDMIQRDDVREVSVRPNILLETLPENFVFDNVRYQPRSVIISGSPDALAQLSDPLDTLPISLVDRTSDFSIEIPLDLPEGDLIPLTASTVTVDIAITEQTTSLSLQNIPISVIGLPDTHTAHVTPDTISVLLNGPVSQLAGIIEADIQAIIDVNNLADGITEVTPTISIRQGQVSLNSRNITLLPAVVGVTLEPIAAVTESPQPEITPEVEGIDD